MKLVEKHIIKKNHKYYKEMDDICFLSKNLYNSTLYTVRQHYFETHGYMNYYTVNKLFTENKQADYCALPRKVGKLVQQLVDKNFKSFFSLLKLNKSGKYNKPIHIPGYLDKIKGRQVTTYTQQALSFKHCGYVKLSGTNIEIKTSKQNIKFVRIVPKNGYIVVEVGYELEAMPICYNNNKYAVIDLGINNLATITSNIHNPIIISGKPLKSINQYYNKQVAYYKSILQTVNNQFTSSRLESLGRIRNNKISDYLHKASRYIVNHLVSNNINTLIIGYNKGWKQDTDIGDKNNQNFVQIPFLKFVRMLEYKCQLKGITVIRQEESYTSKCSFIDKDYIPTYGVDDDLFKPTGRRVYRGLYKSQKGICINADVNGSYNILRKYLTSKAAWNENLFSDHVEVCSTPLVRLF